MPLRVTVVDTGGRPRPSAGLGPWLTRHAPARARGEVVVAIVPDRVSHALNRKFRRVNAPTDVLSFPAALEPGEHPGRPHGRATGEIVIARGVASRQARRLGHSAAKELRILALHGLLHLLGYDHEVDDGQMAGVEARLRRRAGLPAGLIARSK